MIINGFEFFENSGERKTPIYRWATENSQCQRSLYVKGNPLIPADLTAAALALLGCATVVDEGAGLRWISRQTPAVMLAQETPDNPDGEGYLYCTSIPSAEPCSKPTGLDASGTLSTYDWYRFNTVWESLPFDVREDDAVLAADGPLAGLPDEGDQLRRGWAEARYVTKQVDPGAQTVSLKQGIMEYVRRDPAKKEPIPEGWPTTVARQVIRYTWHAVPLAGVPVAAIQRALNGINHTEFDGFSAATLMLADSKLRHYRSAFGQRVCDVSYTAIFKPNFDPVNGLYMGWPSILRVVDGQRRYWPTSCDGVLPTNDNLPAGRSPFLFVDFAALFRPDQS